VLRRVTVQGVSYNDVIITFLRPSGPTKSFLYASLPDILCAPTSKALTKADTETAMGSMYAVTGEKESFCTTERLETILHRLQISAVNNIIFYLNGKTNFNVLMNKPVRFLFVFLINVVVPVWFTVIFNPSEQQQCAFNLEL
jgi:hypothetical protein